MSDYVQVPTRSLDYLERAIDRVSSQVAAVGSYVGEVDEHLQDLDRRFKLMVIEQRQQAALQRAITEIIRVRQEVEAKFGNHKQVRDNMLGILQATDTHLVTTETIARCSEELMLNAPKYWLAPCVVAIAAWIGDNEQLAIRAVEEAVKRDREKTCLLFALVCRRNKRTKVCFEWLAEYLKLQSSSKMKKSVIAFVDAYTNGVFGKDEDHLCDEYIDHWIEELKEKNPAFDSEQKEYWKNYFDAIGASVTYTSQGYDVLKVMSTDFGKINAFVSRITAVNNEGGAKDQISAVLNAIVDHDKLVEEIDEQLRKLVTSYEEGEESALRDEETELQLIKDYKGDEKKAKAVMAQIKQRRYDDPVDFAARLRQAIMDPTSPISSKKTAMVLLKSYIYSAYREYITANKDAYPEVINLSIKDRTKYGAITWSDKTANGENLEEMKKAIRKEYEICKDEAIKAANPKNDKLYWVKVVFTLSIYHWLAQSKYKKTIADIESTYASKANQAVKRLTAAVTARQETNQIVNDFISKEGWDTLQLKEGK